MNRSLLFSLSVIAICALTSANAVDAPARKSGLWEITTRTGTDQTVLRTCVGNATEQSKANAEALGSMKSMCSKQDLRMVDGKLISDSVCTVGGSRATIHATTTFSGDAVAHTIEHNEGTSTYSPPLAGQAKATTVTDGRWVGPCKPGQQPGMVR